MSAHHQYRCCDDQGCLEHTVLNDDDIIVITQTRPLTRLPNTLIGFSVEPRAYDWVFNRAVDDTDSTTYEAGFRQQYSLCKASYFC